MSKFFAWLGIAAAVRIPARLPSASPSAKASRPSVRNYRKPNEDIAAMYKTFKMGSVLRPPD